MNRREFLQASAALGAMRFANDFPGVHLKQGALASSKPPTSPPRAASSGIDLALRVVERYFGPEVAKNTAYQMEYQGQGWLNVESNAVYAVAKKSTAEHPLCPACSMEVETDTAQTRSIKATATTSARPHTRSSSTQRRRVAVCSL